MVVCLLLMKIEQFLHSNFHKCDIVPDKSTGCFAFLKGLRTFISHSGKNKYSKYFVHKICTLICIRGQIKEGPQFNCPKL